MICFVFWYLIGFFIAYWFCYKCDETISNQDWFAISLTALLGPINIPFFIIIYFAAK